MEKNKFIKSKKELNLLVERAKNGKAKSQHELAFYYYTGNNFKQNKTEAFKWWNLASKKDFAKAHFNLAMMYFNGDGIEKNIKKSYEYANLSIKKKHPWQSASYFFLAKNFYIDGLLNKKNFSKSLKYLIIASKLGYLSADYYLGMIYRGEMHTGNLNQKRDNRLSFMYYKRAADKKFVPAILEVVSMLINGEGTKKNLKKAYTYYKKIKNINSNELLENLSVSPTARKSLLKSIDKLRKLFEKSETKKKQKIKFDKKLHDFINKNLLITFSNGCKFTGMTKKDPKDKKKLIPHGLGYAIWPDGACYKGQYKNGTFDGWGHYVSPGSHEFIGVWKKGFFSNGQMKKENGENYTGEFKMSRMHGKGKMNFSGNYTYEGHWKDGDAHGKGKLTYLKKFEQHEKGKVMEGNFYKGRWHGNFRISYSNGETNKVKYNMGNFVKKLK